MLSAIGAPAALERPQFAKVEPKEEAGATPTLINAKMDAADAGVAR